MSKGANVEVKGFSRIESVENLYVSGNLLTSGTFFGRFIVDSDSNLVLSSSTGQITVSGNFDVLGNLTQKGSPVGGGQVTGSTNFFTNNQLDAQGLFVNSSGSLILSSSVGSVVALSASQDFVNKDKNYHITAISSRLILSSSVGSKIHVSGSVIASGTALNPAFCFSEDPLTGFYLSDPNVIWITIGGSPRWDWGTTAFGCVTSGGPYMLNGASAIRTPSFIPNGTDDYTGIGGISNYLSLIVGKSQGMGIFSSSTGILAHISGGLQIGPGYISATLPSAPPTGTLAYVSDLGFLAIYTGSGKWYRIASSSF